MQQQDTQFVPATTQTAQLPSAPEQKSGPVPLSDDMLALVGGGAGPHDNWK